MTQIFYNTHPIPLPRGNDPLFIVGNGNASTRSNAFEVSNNGHSIVYDVNGTGGAERPITPPPYRSSIKGGSYTDNVIYGWATVIPGALMNPNPSYERDFGVASVTRVVGTVGQWDITLSITDPVTGSPTFLDEVSIVATLLDTNTHVDSNICGTVTASRIGNNNNMFRIKTFDYKISMCTTHDQPFYFIVTGRKDSW